MTKQPLFSAMTTDFDADIKNFKEILNELELRTHTKNGYKFSPDAKMAAGWWFFEIYMEQEFARKIIESDLISKKKGTRQNPQVYRRTVEEKKVQGQNQIL